MATSLESPSSIDLPGAWEDVIRRGMRSADPHLSRFSPLPRILADDRFQAGSNGWTELTGNYDASGDMRTMADHMRDFRPPQLSGANFFESGTHGAVSGTYSLKLATRPLAGHTSTAIRRLTSNGVGLVQIEAYFTYKSEATIGRDAMSEIARNAEWNGNSHPSEAEFGCFTVATDICNDGGIRYHNVARYRNTTLDNEFDRRWVYPTIPEPTRRDQYEGRVKHKYLDDFTAPDPNSWEAFTEPMELCYNEVSTKINWHYVRFLVDTRSRRNVELQINDRVIDMSGVDVPVYEQKYEGLDTLLNFYFSVRTHANVRNFLFLDSVVISADW